MYWTNGGGERVWCVGLQVFMLCRVLQDIALVGFWKKNFKNFFWKVWSWWKSPYLCSRFPKRSGRSETFWLMCFSSFADEACRSFLLRRFRKKVWKKVRKDLEGICKSIYLCIRFRLISGAGKREAKRVLKDIERFENKQQVRVREEIQRI
jgi:hypothetical protein